MSDPTLLKAWLDFISSLIWPTVVLIILVVFKSQIEKLLGRIKSGKVAGAEFSFSEAASAYISSRIDKVAEEPDSTKRAKLVGEIKGVADALGAIHPISLSLLISGGYGDNIWLESAYTDKKDFFDALQRSGLTRITEKRDERGKLEAHLEPTAEGKSLLKAIGFYDNVKA